MIKVKIEPGDTPVHVKLRFKALELMRKAPEKETLGLGRMAELFRVDYPKLPVEERRRALKEFGAFKSKVEMEGISGEPAALAEDIRDYLLSGMRQLAQ